MVHVAAENLDAGSVVSGLLKIFLLVKLPKLVVLWSACDEALLIDPGSPENLCGDEWSSRMHEAAVEAASGRPA